MIPFCDNKLCDQHNIPAAPVTQILRNGKLLTISRHELTLTPDRKKLYFCATCYTAIELYKDFKK